MARSVTQARIITRRELAPIRYPLPKNWTGAIGILKGKGIDPVRYQRQIRAEWGKRLKRQIRLGRVRHGR